MFLLVPWLIVLILFGRRFALLGGNLNRPKASEKAGAPEICEFEELSGDGAGPINISKFSSASGAPGKGGRRIYHDSLIVNTAEWCSCRATPTLPRWLAMSLHGHR